MQYESELNKAYPDNSPKLDLSEKEMMNVCTRSHARIPHVRFIFF